MYVPRDCDTCVTHNLKGLPGAEAPRYPTWRGALGQPSARTGYHYVFLYKDLQKVLSCDPCLQTQVSANRGHSGSPPELPPRWDWAPLAPLLPSDWESAIPVATTQPHANRSTLRKRPLLKGVRSRTTLSGVRSRRGLCMQLRHCAGPHSYPVLRGGDSHCRG